VDGMLGRELKTLEVRSPSADVTWVSSSSGYRCVFVVSARYGMDRKPANVLDGGVGPS
jgi:hypothetical protein